ncbi:MAG: septum site-determining protein [Marmoricola sp.]|nr:septum site-determining protein [Marmoricola sp.]
MDDVPAPLLVTADERLLAELSRLAAAAGVVPVVAADVGAALRAWAGTSTVLVGADLVAELARARPSRRPQVHVVGAGELTDDVFREAIGCGAESVVTLPASESWLVELLTDAADGGAAASVTVGVVGGAGGVGATVLACAVAQVCARRTGTLLLDADPLGAGVDRVLGLEAVGGVRWDGLVHATGRISARSLREALPSRDGLTLLTWPVDRVGDLPAFAVREALSAAGRGFPVVVVDVPRQAGAIATEVLSHCDRLVLVTTVTVPAVAAAARVARQLPSATTVAVLRGSAAGSVAPEIGRLLGLPVLATMPDQRGLDEAIGLGVGPLRSRRGPLARTARYVAEDLAPA